MKVNILQQFLRNLILPLKASSAAAATLTALERACQGLDPFQDKDVAEFAEFFDPRRRLRTRRQMAKPQSAHQRNHRR